MTDSSDKLPPPLAFADLQKHSFSSEIVAAFEAHYGSPLPQKLQDYLVDALGSADNRAHRVFEWVEQTAGIALQILHKTAAPAAYPLFWIRLWSLIYEYHPKMMEGAELLGRTFMGPYVRLLDNLVTTFTEEDLHLITYMRHHHVHIQVDSIRIGIKTDPEGAVNVKSPRYPDAERVTRAVLKRHNWDQQSAALEVAQRIVKPLTLFFREAQKVHAEKL